MEKLLNPYDKQYLKMAMLKHEETFKQQVYELHRLYRIQKVLMKSIKNGRPNGQNQERWGSGNGISLTTDQINDNHHRVHQNPRPGFDLEQPAKENITESSDENGEPEIEDESEIQLTLGPTIYYQRKIKAETPPTSDSGPSFSSSSTGSSHRSKELLTAHKWGLTLVPEAISDFQNARRNSFDVEEQASQDRLKQPPWFFQALSLKMT
ncbi:uncharacterized protein LOC127805023 [Diospyros lotus]|uniref:uncharacterized protein LOC127805023 n=1 Tax=Diospyros lotus TaxID=55363 RepID=UPI0022578777|nr:uncharacterized protein LOC127805023 [Diospyros lotus]XP_052198146.1 uncharacterized protein LOC127805023 [Diospyros lotus]